MLSMSENYSWITETRYLGPAHVLEIEGSNNRVCLGLEVNSEINEVWAQLAIPTPCQLSAGDKVLAMGNNIDELYIIGILDRVSEEAPVEKTLHLSGGSRAQVSGPADEQSIQIYSKKRELLFEYDEKKGKAKVNLETGDIEFVSQKGNINFYAGQDILLSGQAVGITGRSGIVLGILNTLGKIQSAFTLKPRQMNLQSPEIEMEAQQGDFQIGKTSFTGKLFSGNVNVVKLNMDRIETVVQTFIQKAKSVYKTVSELSQLKTGRMRTLVESTFHLKSKKIFMKADEDVKVKADKIHLG